ncbi:MAG: hypothetical protein O7G84_01190 [Gammaproteobacteria bacterium]|nr:hypothetical protein [Gammaproteobacteria bacterium]
MATPELLNKAPLMAPAFEMICDPMSRAPVIAREPSSGSSNAPLIAISVALCVMPMSFVP